MVMQWSIVFPGRVLMTTCTCLIALKLKLGSMRVMAVRAFNVFAKHFALQKRAVLKDFVANLSIFVIQIAIEQVHHLVIRKFFSRLQTSGNQRTARMTLGTGIDLRAVIGVFEVNLQTFAIATVPEQRFVLG